MISWLALALSLLIVAANVAAVSIFVLRWDRRAGQQSAGRHDRTLARQDAG
ncbi:MAG: hypothetical protein ABIQ09_03630 [Jatrophihabitantaceae bacterium]